MSLFKIPGKIDPRAKPYWDLIRKHGGSRTSMVNFITDIGGYYCRDGRFAIEFNVSAAYANLEADNLWKLLNSDDIDVGPSGSESPAELEILKTLFLKAHAESEDTLWSEACADAYRSWSESDVPYETFMGTRVQWSWGLYGRGGKHLCITECAGWDLRSPVEDLREDMMRRDSSGYDIDTKHVSELFVLCVQNTVDLTTERVAREVEYQAAWRLWVSDIEPQMEAALELHRHRQVLAESVESLLLHLNTEQDHTETVKSLCLLAGIVVKE